MRSYESIVVLDGSLNSEAIAAEVDKISQILVKRGAATIEHSDWGKKTVAYPLQKKSLGHYQQFTFTTENTELVSEATRELLLRESVLKIQTHSLSSRRRKFKGNPKFATAGSIGFDDSDDDE